ncbi:MAG TPA: sulfite exporter TauE/SafE family protein [Methylomirabilota bacterium]|nr:sulfite exporter TauE/SafE family protein [Methylomirabilota bacterium]
MLSLVALATAAAAFVKGSIGFGFPTLGTPLLSLLVDVKTAFLVLIVPNIVMDGLQFVRGGAPRATVRRMLPLVAFGAVGTVIGTHLLAMLASRTVMLILGGFILAFVALNATRLAPRLPPRWEPWASPVAGLLAGVVGGITNVPGTPLVLYFQALGLPKQEFVSAVAFTFVLYKLVQLAAVTWYGLMSGTLLLASLGLTLAALAGFAVGLRVQDRLQPRAFNRAVLVFLALLGSWLVVRNIAMP